MTNRKAYWFTVEMTDPADRYGRKFNAWLAGWSYQDILENFEKRYPAYKGCKILRLIEQKEVPDFLELPKELKE
jgi:hypothetical protein